MSDQFKEAYKYSHASTKEYQQWIEENEWDRDDVFALQYNPLISVVVPVYNVIDEQLVECIESVRLQTYTNWELILVDDCSTWDNVRKTLEKYQTVPSIRICYRQKNGNISEATNTGIKMAKGDFIAFADCDDVLAKNALFEVAKALNENREYDFIYSDEDKLSEDGSFRHDPFFKPDWSPDTYMAMNYTNHLSVFRTELVKKTGGLRTEFNGSQDYDFTLRFMECSDNKRVYHIPKVLYYWRERKESVASTVHAKSYALDAARKAKEEAIARRGLKADVEFVEDVYQYHVVYHNPKQPMVSIIIPSKDNFGMLKICVDTILEFTQYPNYEIVIVDNGSQEEVREKIEQYIQGKPVLYYYEKMPFNFSRMCNIGAKKAHGQFFLFLNDDMEIFQEKWLDILVGHASLAHVGAVGAKLYYPDSKQIQHAGVFILPVGPSHALLNMNDSFSYYFERNRVEYNYLAVTGACMMIAANKYWQIDGFYEDLAVAFNDIDICMKLYQAGYYNVLRNDVILYHHESASRGDDRKSKEKMKRLLAEREKLFSRYPQLCSQDPFYSPNLAQNAIDFSINVDKSIRYTKIEEISWDKKVQAKLTESQTLYGNIDIACVVDGVLLISGWILDKECANSGKMKKKILLTDKNRKIFLLDTNDVYRADVTQAFFGVDNGQSYGFNVFVPSDILELEMVDYQIDILLEYEGKFIRHRQPMSIKKLLKKPISFVPEQRIIHRGNIQAENTTDIILYLENIADETMHYIVEGWSIMQQNENDWTKQLLLINKQGHCFTCEIERVQRLDVARHYIEKPFVLYSGFRCFLRKSEISRLGYNIEVGMLYTNKRDRSIKKKILSGKMLQNMNL